MTVEQDIAREIVVFNSPNGPFSNDPRWNDSRVREAWLARQSEGDPVEDSEEEEELPPYAEWNNDDLRAELSERKLSVEGKKAELIKRLEADDAKAEA